MRLLLDTNILLWVLAGSSRLTSSTRAVVMDPENQILFSAASIWEVAIKAALGRADFQVSPETILDAARDSHFTELPVRSDVAVRAAALPMHHRDPFDRLLVAQAMMEPAKLYTSDARLAVYSELVVRV